ncbi:MAG: hypothetical protein ACLUD0_06590 [Eubacterium ramulus]
MGKEKEEGETKESMSPQDKVERVLKEIHVTFSKSEMMDGHPDKVINSTERNFWDCWIV